MRGVAGLFVAFMATSCCSSNASQWPSAQQSFAGLDGASVAKLEEAALVARSPALRFELQRLMRQVQAFDHSSDLEELKTDAGAAVYPRLESALPAHLAFESAFFCPWSDAVAEDASGATIQLNQRWVPKRSLDAYVGTIWHEVAHKAGYRHAGNSPQGNACTVPNVTADAATVAAHRVTAGSWGELDATACQALKQALQTVGP